MLHCVAVLPGQGLGQQCFAPCRPTPSPSAHISPATAHPCFALKRGSVTFRKRYSRASCPELASALVEALVEPEPGEDDDSNANANAADGSNGNGAAGAPAQQPAGVEGCLAFVALVDSTGGAEYLELVRGAVQAALEAVPPSSLFGVVTFGGEVRCAGRASHNDSFGVPGCIVTFVLGPVCMYVVCHSSTKAEKGGEVGWARWGISLAAERGKECSHLWLTTSVAFERTRRSACATF